MSPLTGGKTVQFIPFLPTCISPSITKLWRHRCATHCEICLSTSLIFMFSCHIFISTCQDILLTCHLITWLTIKKKYSYPVCAIQSNNLNIWVRKEFLLVRYDQDKYTTVTCFMAPTLLTVKPCSHICRTTFWLCVYRNQIADEIADIIKDTRQLYKMTVDWLIDWL